MISTTVSSRLKISRARFVMHEIGNLFVADHGAKNGHIIFLHNKALRLFSVLTKWNCRSEALSLRKKCGQGGPLFSRL